MILAYIFQKLGRGTYVHTVTYDPETQGKKSRPQTRRTTKNHASEQEHTLVVVGDDTMILSGTKNIIIAKDNVSHFQSNPPSCIEPPQE